MTSGWGALCTWFNAHGTSCTEVLGFATGVLNVWLVTREHIASWPIGVLNALFYMVVFARTGLYSDTGLQVVYGILSLYGWWYWWRGDSEASPVPVTRTTVTRWRILLPIIIGTWLVLTAVTSRIPGAVLPGIDSLLVAVSLVAQWMMTRKLLENWLLWIGVDVVYIGLFLRRDLPLTAVLYAIFLGLAIHGYFAWRRSWRAAPK